MSQSDHVSTMLLTRLEVYLLTTQGPQICSAAQASVMAISESIATCVSESFLESGKQVGQRVVMWVCT